MSEHWVRRGRLAAGAGDDVNANAGASISAATTAPRLKGPLARLSLGPGPADVSACDGAEARDVAGFLGSSAGPVVGVLALGFGQAAARGLEVEGAL